MPEFKSGFGSGLGILVRVVRIFETFQVRTIGQPSLDIKKLVLCVILVLILQKNL